MQLAVQPHALEHLGPIRLEAAVHVVQTHARDDGRGRVEDAREEPAQERVVPPCLPAGDEVEALVELGEKLRDLGGIVLEVGVDRHEDLAAGLQEPGLAVRQPSRSCDGGGRRRRCRVASWRWWSTAMLPSVEPSSTKTTSNASPARLEGGGDLAVELLERGFLVEQRNDDRDHVSGGYRRPRSSASAPQRTPADDRSACERARHEPARVHEDRERERLALVDVEEPERRDARSLIGADVPG